jgi:hypothetical protein
MSTLAERFFALTTDERRAVHQELVRYALGRWRDYAASQGAMRYRESVVGTEQSVDADLPADAFECGLSGQDTASVAARYREPIAALQDGDLSFPEPVAFAYYAVYNFFRRYALHDEVDDWLLVNQASSSEEDRGKWEAMLAGAIERATSGRA